MLHLLLLLAFAAIAYYFYQANGRKPARDRSSDVARSTLLTAMPVSTARPQSNADSCCTAVAPFADSVAPPHTDVAEIQTAVVGTPTDIKWLKAESVKSDVEMKAMAEKRSGDLGVNGSTENPPEAPPQVQTTPAAEEHGKMDQDQQLPTTPAVTSQAAVPVTAIQAPTTTDSAILQVLQTMPSDEQRHVIDGLIASTPPSKESPTAEIPLAIEPKHELLSEAPVHLPSSTASLAHAQPTLSEQSTQKPQEAVEPSIAFLDQSAQKSPEAVTPPITPHNDNTQASSKSSSKKIKKRTLIKEHKSDSPKKGKKIDRAQKSNKSDKGSAKDKEKKKAEASSELKKRTALKNMLNFGKNKNDEKAKRKSQQTSSKGK